MTIKDYKDGKLVTLSKQIDTRPKLLNLFYSLGFLISAIFILRNFLFDYSSIGEKVVSSVAIIALLLGSFRFRNKACMTEKLFVNKEHLTIIKQGLSSANKQTFDITKISNFRHLSKPEVTKHPLSGGTFDYLGFQTEQQVINDMLGDNRVAFDYEGRTVTFGNAVYSWDFNELEIQLYDVTGNDFRYDDEFEKTFKATK